MDNIIIGFIVDRLEKEGITFVQSIQRTYVPFSLQSMPDRHIFVQNDQKPIGSFLFYEDRCSFICSENSDTLEQMFQIDVLYEEYQFDLELIKREALILLLSILI